MRKDPSGLIGFDRDGPRINPWAGRKDRACAFQGCDTLLSIYNASTLCWQHETSRVFALPGPQQRSGRRKASPGAAHPFG